MAAENSRAALCMKDLLFGFHSRHSIKIILKYQALFPTNELYSLKRIDLFLLEVKLMFLESAAVIHNLIPEPLKDQVRILEILHRLLRRLARGNEIPHFIYRRFVS
jgi:hypothetical protein